MLCCSDMAKAHESGTDNEGYEKLVWRLDGNLTIGCDLPPIKFCPWCGHSLTQGDILTEMVRADEAGEKLIAAAKEARDIARYPYTHHGPAVHGSKMADYLISEYHLREDKPELFVDED